jgi:hypothetical protein
VSVHFNFSFFVMPTPRLSVRLKQIIHNICIIRLRTTLIRDLTLSRKFRSTTTYLATAVILRSTRGRTSRYLVMEHGFREARGDMPYHRRHDGLSGSEVHDIEHLATFLNDLITRADNLPPGRAKDFFLLVVLLLFQAMLLIGSVEHRNLVPVNRDNENRMIDSFTDEVCWHNLRFRKPELMSLVTTSSCV